MMSESNLAEMHDRLLEVGRHFPSLVESSSAIFLFGSRAMNVNQDESDWDLLCISNVESVRSKHVDLVCVTEDRARSLDWLGSELASHVANFGIVLHGDTTCLKRVGVSDQAVVKKREKIIRRVSIVHPWWSSFAPSVQRKHFRLIRDDLSRLNYLISGEPVPPTPLLNSTSLDGFLSLVSQFKKTDLLPRSCITQLASLAASTEIQQREWLSR